MQEDQFLAYLHRLAPALMELIIMELPWRSRCCLSATSSPLVNMLRATAAPYGWMAHKCGSEAVSMFDVVAQSAGFSRIMHSQLVRLSQRPGPWPCHNYDDDCADHNDGHNDCACLSIAAACHHNRSHVTSGSKACMAPVPLDASVFFEIAPTFNVSARGAWRTPVFTSLTTRGGGSTRNRVLRPSVLECFSGTTCLCISMQTWATGLSSMHKDFDPDVLVFIDTEGAATGITGAVFELETIQEMQEVTPCPLGRIVESGSLLPAELRERGILWQAKCDRQAYAGNGYVMSPCCGRAAACSLSEYLEKICQTAESDTYGAWDRSGARCKLWRQGSLDEVGVEAKSVYELMGDETYWAEAMQIIQEMDDVKTDALL